jgi:WD40 repeat protein
MRFSSDGSELITAQAHSGDVRIYDTTEWTERNMRGGDAQTRDMAISDDETMVALADREGNVHVLALATGELLELISLDDRDITNVEFIADDRHLLITGATGPVEIITLDAEELLEIARRRISRTFTSDECQQFAIEPCATLEELRAG